MLKCSRYLLGDRDAAYKQEFSKSAKRVGIHEVQAVSNLVARQNFIRAKMVASVVSPFPRATFHVSTS